MVMESARAEALAAEALAWMAGDQEVLVGFLSQTGLGLDDLRARAGDPEFLGFVLDHLLSHEALLIAFCEVRGVPPERPREARAALPGGLVPDWT